YYGFLTDLPQELFFPPPGIMMLFGGFPPAWFFNGIELLLMVSLTAVLLGWKTTFFSILTGLLIFTGNGFSFSMGKINHDVLLPLVPLIMAFSNWGARFSIDSSTGLKNKDVQNWPVVMLSLLLGYMMMTAGFAKLLGGWLDISTQATYGHLLNQHFVNGRTGLLSSFFIGLEQPVFWIFLDYATIIFEIGFLPAVFFPRIFRLFVGFAVIFHFSVMVMLNISFLPNLGAYSLFLVNWNCIARNRPVVMNTLQAAFERLSDSPAWMRACLGGVLAAGLYVFNSPLALLDHWVEFPSDLLFHEVVVLSLYFLLALGVIITMIYKSVRELPDCT
ncbi:MAG: HTTM domain-containing protein, partial [Cyclonatronaceae bacterium]